MSFSELHLDPTDQALLEELKKAVEQPTYSLSPGGPAAPNQIFENLEVDSQIPDEPISNAPASRRAFVGSLRATAPHSAGGCLLSGREFCRSHQRQGAEAASGAVLGQVQDLDKLAAWLHAGSPYALKEVRDWLRNLVDLPEEPATRLERQRADIEKTTLTRYQMWSFYIEDGSAPFTKISSRRSELRNRLGLGHFEPSAEMVYWTASLPAGMTAHQPTGWDADLNNPCWRPTGRTEPLDGSGSAQGLLEVVHSSVGPQDLVDSIRRAEP